MKLVKLQPALDSSCCAVGPFSLGASTHHGFLKFPIEIRKGGNPHVLSSKLLGYHCTHAGVSLWSSATMRSIYCANKGVQMLSQSSSAAPNPLRGGWEEGHRPRVLQDGNGKIQACPRRNAFLTNHIFPWFLLYSYWASTTLFSLKDLRKL